MFILLGKITYHKRQNYLFIPLSFGILRLQIPNPLTKKKKNDYKSHDLLLSKVTQPLMEC